MVAEGGTRANGALSGAAAAAEDAPLLGQRVVLGGLSARPELNGRLGASNSESALMYAAGEGLERMVELLIRRGAELNLQSSDGWNALMYATIFNRSTVSNGGHLRITWLQVLPFVVQIVHHINAVCVSKELASPGWSVAGRFAHHVVDGFCHTSFYVTVAACYARACGCKMPSWPTVALFYMVRMSLEQLEIIGIPYRLKFHQTEDFHRSSSLLTQIIVPHSGVHSPLSPGGLNYWSYLSCVLASIFAMVGVRTVLVNWRALIAQVLFGLFFVFNPAGHMLFAGSQVTEERNNAMHLAHCADYLCWQSTFWLTVFPCPKVSSRD